jgi:aspartate kinase
MLTDDRFTRATPDLEALTTRAQAEVRPLLERGVVPVTQGFIGATADGRTTTLGRGGSDFTAALLGAALRVDLVEIWTDVDGILTADPRIAPQAARLSDATYDEAAELATFGAKVLHPATQVPLAALGIPFVILNSFAADHPGTVVHAEAERATPGPSPVRSIAWRKGVILVNVKAPRMVGAFGFLRALFAVFERHEIPVDVIATSEVNVSLTIDESPNLEVICNELRELGEVTVFDRRAIIAVVGIGLRGTGGIAARVFQTIHEAGITIDVISQGASEISITFVIAEQDGPNAVRALHREFLERSPS